MENRTSRLSLIVGLSAALAIGHAATLRAAAGSLFTSSGHGWTVTVDTRWVEGYGYRPVWIDVTPTATTVADRSLHVELKVTGATYPQQHLTFSQDIEVPAGTATTPTVPFSVPQVFTWQIYELRVWEDGRFLKNLTQRVGVNNWRGASSEGLPSVLIVTDQATAAAPVRIASTPRGATVVGPVIAAPNTDVLAQILPVENVQTTRFGAPTAINTAQVLQYPSDLVAALAVDHLPERWIDYTGVDLVCVSLAQLDRLAAEQPARLAAMRRWTSAGGNLFVSGIGDDFARLAELERRLDLPAPDGPPPDNSLPSAGWKPPNKSDYSLDLGRSFGQTMVPPMSQVAPPARDAFVTRPLELGMVVAVAADDVFAQPPEVWGCMLRTLTPERWLGYRRFGISQERDNDDFWNWLIPGVGLAPVTEFQVLITLFVIAIGPVNYFWLRRRGRLHLLLLIVPACALAATSGLFGYAVLADGLGVRVRARSYTAIDQRRGEAVSWARISYHAGIAPSGGLNFPADVAVLPILAEGLDNRQRPPRGVIWSDEGQNLARGWLASRTPTQLLTVRSRATQAQIRWLKPPGPGEPPQIENLLGTRIARLLLADEEGNHFRALDVAAGATVSLEPTDAKTEQGEWLELYRAALPAVPVGFDPTVSRYRSRRFWRPTNNLPAASLATGRLETMLHQVPGVAGATQRPLAPRSYVAFVDCSPELAWGVESPQVEAGLHVVEGRW